MGARYFLLLLILFGYGALAGVNLGTDLFVGATRTNGQLDDYLRSHQYLFFTFSGEDFGMGPVIQVDRPHYYHLDLEAGYGFHFGSPFAFHLEGGVLRRFYSSTAGSTNSNGLWGLVAFSYGFKWVRIFLPLQARYFLTGSKKRLEVDGIPYIGIRARL